MTPLNDYQKQLLFDYSLGMTSGPETDEAQRLLGFNQEAAELHDMFQGALAPLAILESEPCPEDLTERLFLRLNSAATAASGRDRLEELLAAEQSEPRTIRIPLWRNWSEVIAAAAAIILFVGILFPTVGFMRNQYWQTRCGGQLGSIYGGLRNYVSDHDGLLPAVAMAPGTPWWKVGYQGKENHSNSRRAWLLVTGGYVEPQMFLCRGRREARGLNFEGFKIQDLKDFPSRMYISFSVCMTCPTSNRRGLTSKRVLMADRNPLFEDLPSDHSTLLRLEISERQVSSNSRNHNYRGQNALLYDGSVEFTKVRYTSISDDDIYTLRDMCCGTKVHGCEVPSCDTDFFLVP
jgi:hypothetical protein